jgi:ABC-type glycerol-3-phosphate transport system permease component
MFKSLKLSKLTTNILVAVLIVFLVAIVGFPLAWMALSSLKPGVELFTIPPKVLPQNWSLEWYMQAFSNPNVIRYFLNSLLIASVVMVAVMIIGTMTAYSLTRFRYKGRKLILITVLAAYCVPPIMLMLPLYKIVNAFGLPESHLGVIIAHLTVTLPFSVWLLVSFFKKLPKEINEAAVMDGANEMQVFLKVELPLCVSGVLSTGIMAFIMSWNEFLLSSVLISKESMKTLTVGLANYISSTHIDWGIIMALGTITTIPVIILFVLVQKYFVEGMTAGAVKG